MEIENKGYKYFYKEAKISDKKIFVVVVHGICEHLKRYDNFSNYLNENGYSTLRFDLIGHGMSDGVRGDINSYLDFIDQLEFFILKIRKENPDYKIILFGHSMGGLVVSLYEVLSKNKVDGIILSGAPTRRLKKVFLLNFITDKRSKNIRIDTDYNFRLSDLSTNDEINKKYAIDELVLENFTAHLLREMFIKGRKVLFKNIKKFTSDVLFLHGKSDKIVPKSHSLKTFKLISSKSKDIKIFPNMKHELINDVKNKIVYETILNWLNNK